MTLKKTENKKKPADVDKLSLREISAECFDQRPEPRLHVIGLVSAMPCFSSCPRVLNRVTKKEKKIGRNFVCLALRQEPYI